MLLYLQLSEIVYAFRIRSVSKEGTNHRLQTWWSADHSPPLSHRRRVCWLNLSWAPRSSLSLRSQRWQDQTRRGLCTESRKDLLDPSCSSSWGLPEEILPIKMRRCLGCAVCGKPSNPVKISQRERRGRREKGEDGGKEWEKTSKKNNTWVLLYHLKVVQN